MVSFCYFVAVACAVIQINEVSGSNGSVWKVASREEIMANMTPDVAARTVLGMKAIRQNPTLMNLISSKFGTHRFESQKKGAGSQLQTALRGSGATDPTGYSGVEKAKMLLNEMGMESQGTFDESVQTCKVFDHRTIASLDRMQLAVSTFNADAADARGRVIGAQGKIATLTTNLIQTTEAFEQHKADCKKELDLLNAQLRTVLGDIEVMASVLKLTDCSSSFLLVQCHHCNNAIYLQHDKVAKMLGKLKSGIAKQIVKRSLDESFADSLDKKQPTALDQVGIERLRSRSTFSISSSDVPVPVGGINTSDVPQAPEPFDCAPTSKCTIGSSPNCQKLKDRFLAVQAGIVDQRDNLEGEIFFKQNWCEEETLGFTQQIDAMNENLRKNQANLATATEDQNTAEKGSHQKSAQHASTSTEYTRTMSECCDTQNTAKSELCALEKIRGELMKMEGDPTFIADCVVSEWMNEECSATCGGGFGKQTRRTVVQPEGGGQECPALEAIQACNEEPCPVDCQLDSWGGWSACSAECGGGVKERKRDVEIQPQHDGEPCGETEDEEACNIQDCSEDCDLTEWSAWSGCSKACNGGSQRRTKGIAKLKKGEGKCWEPTSAERLQFKDCNPQDCSYLITAPRTLLNCDSKVDVVIVIDGSASLGQEGWANSKALVGKLTSAFSNGTQDAKVAVELFSGPKTWDDYVLCTGDANGTTIDMKAQCGIEWVSHFSNDTETLQSAADAMEWPQSTTLTSVALGQAENELTQGREDANSVVIVITDGVPMSQRNTKSASNKLQEKARVLWVPVGSKAPIQLIEELASLPQKEHVITIDSFDSLMHDDVVNRIVSSTCPVLS